MRNLLIILTTLIPFICFSQQTTNEEIHPNSKIYHQKQPTETAANRTAITVERQPLNRFELKNDECRTTRIYDNPKVYFEIGDEMPFRRINRNQHVEVAVNAVAKSVDQKSTLPVYDEDDLKLGFFNSHEKQTTPLKTIADNFMTIRVYENAKIYYEIKVPADFEKTLFTINHRPQ